MNDEQSVNNVPTSPAAVESACTSGSNLARWFDIARHRAGDYALSEKGLRPVKPAAAATSEMVRRVMRTEITQAVTRIHFLQASPATISLLHRVKVVMTAMANECAAYINAFGVDDEDALSELARACMTSLETRHPKTQAVEIARTEMVKVVWGAQDSARAMLRNKKSLCRLRFAGSGIHR